MRQLPHNDVPPPSPLHSSPYTILHISLVVTFTRDLDQVWARKTRYCVHSTSLKVHRLFFLYVGVGPAVLTWHSKLLETKFYRALDMELIHSSTIYMHIMHYMTLVLCRSEWFWWSPRENIDDIGLIRRHTKFDEICSLTARSASQVVPFFRFIWLIDQSCVTQKKKRERNERQLVSLARVGWEIMNIVVRLN